MIVKYGRQVRKMQRGKKVLVMGIHPTALMMENTMATLVKKHKVFHTKRSRAKTITRFFLKVINRLSTLGDFESMSRRK